MHAVLKQNCTIFTKVFMYGETAVVGLLKEKSTPKQS